MLDERIFFILNSLAGRGEIWDWLIIFLAQYSAYLLVSVFLVVLYRLEREWKDRIYWFCWAFGAAIIARLGVASLIRFFLHRPRPFMVYPVNQLIPESDWSFPSGHATFFFALSLIVYYFNKKLGLWFMGVSIIMGLARVMAGLHYPSDIIGGAIVGLAVSYILFWVGQARATHRN